ncbi:MAG: phage portal protein [Chloroflexi bacterium]|nr:phage portal protein [Chloroflexota bacterium]
MLTRLKALTRMVFGRARGVLGLFLPRSQINYAELVGDGLRSSVVMAPVLWIARTFPEAPIQIIQTTPDGEEENLAGHPLAQLLERPNPSFSGHVLWMATMLSWVINGNAYWVKIRNRLKQVVELWYVPHWLIEPVAPADGSAYIDHYDYRPALDLIRLEPEDVVHFRYGLDPHDIRKGLSPLTSVLREVFTDDEAAAMSAALLRNMGVPGLVISPDTDHELTDDDVKEVKEYMSRQFAGDQRGTPLVARNRTKVEQFGFSPEQLNLRALRQVPEERVSAVLGIPAIVTGFGAGLARSTFANYEESRAAAYEGNIIPSQRIIAAELKHQLLVDFEPDVRALRVGFDLRGVRVLQEDMNALADRANRMVQGGWITVGEGRRLVGMASDASHEVYLRGANVIEVPVRPAEAAPLLTAGRRNGHGAKADGLDLTYGSAEHERRWKAAMARTEPHEVRVAEAVRGLFATQEAEVLGRLRKGRKDAADTRRTPFDRTAWDRRIADALTPHLAAALEDGATATLDDLAVDAAFDLADPRAASWLRERTVRLAGEVNLTTEQAIREALAAGTEAGEGIPQLTRRVQDVFADASRNRARVIARTETLAASNAGTLEAARQSGVAETKTWYSSLDQRVRPSHAAAHGQVRRLDEDFEVGGSRGPAPGQIAAAGESIQCRCVMQIGTTPAAAGAPLLAARRTNGHTAIPAGS